MNHMSILILSCWAAVYLHDTSAAPSNGGYEVCQSETCQKLANEYLRSMDLTVDPCTDFYKYACGNWPKDHQPDGHSDRWSAVSIIANRTNHRLKEILETGWIAGEPVSVKKAKQLYRACMDEQTIENRGTSAIHSFLNLNGGWPILTGVQSTPRPWQIVDSYYNSLLGKSAIFTISVIPDLKATDKNVLALQGPSVADLIPVPVPANATISFSDPVIARYKDFVTEVVIAMARAGRFIVDPIQLEKDIEGIVLFEANLKSLVVAPINLTAGTPNFSTAQQIMTIAELQKRYDSAKPQTPKGQIDFLQRIRELFAGIKSISIDSSEGIVFDNQQYFQKLVGLLDRTPERDIVNAIHWSFVKQTIGMTNREMAQITERYARSNLPPTTNPLQSPPRWVTCVARNELQHPLAYAYVQKYFPENAKDTAVKMINEIEMEMKKQIMQAKWLDDATKRAAQEKIAKMVEFVGYPDWYKNPSRLDNRYQNLAIGSFYLENGLLVRQFGLRHQLESLRKPLDKNEVWIVSPITVNAFYSPTANSLTFPAVFLQPPFFDAEHPDSVNYGGIGAVIGHEISHGFDNVGSQFDQNGNAKKWWSDATQQEFGKRAKCFVDQFNNFHLHVNNVTYGWLGFHTLGENIADSTGMRAAFDAFKTHVKDSREKEVKLPGLENFTREQLFFLSYAVASCENVKPEDLLRWVVKDTHSAPAFRVQGTLANTNGFAETFNCAKDTPMNPQNKCGIWN